MAELLIACGPETKEVVLEAMRQSDLRTSTPVFADTLAEASNMISKKHGNVRGVLFDGDLPLGSRQQVLNRPELRMMTLGFKLEGGMQEALDIALSASWGGVQARRLLVARSMASICNRGVVLGTNSDDFMHYVRFHGTKNAAVGVHNVSPHEVAHEQGIGTARGLLEKLSLKIEQDLALSQHQRTDGKASRYVQEMRAFRKFTDERPDFDSYEEAREAFRRHMAEKEERAETGCLGAEGYAEASNEVLPFTTPVTDLVMQANIATLPMQSNFAKQLAVKMSNREDLEANAHTVIHAKAEEAVLV